MSLADARLYLVATHELRAGRLADLVPELAAAGVDLIQLREKDMDAGEVIKVGEPVRAACAVAGIPFIVNDRPDVALALEADGVHVGQNDLPPAVARRIVPGAILGLSTHATGEIDEAIGLRPPPDYLAVGPVYETPTKPGRAAAGLDLLRFAAPRLELPWFAIGGLDQTTLPAALEAGARRIVVVRAITEAPDPAGAAAELRRTLDEAG